MEKIVRTKLEQNFIRINGLENYNLIMSMGICLNIKKDYLLSLSKEEVDLLLN